MSRMRLLLIPGLVVGSGFVFGWGASGGEWKPAKGPLMTRWAKDVKADAPLPEYPRPQLARKDWKNLNGVWQLGFGKAGDAPPVGKDLAEQILVPFPVESALSGVMKRADRLWYRRTFKVPEGWAGSRVLLHFGAVDWESQVWVNGKDLGTHKGGYDAFSYDLTDALKAGGGDQELIVRVFDPTDAGTQPRGKQVREPGGIFYEPTTGIWQTVWLEPVPATHIRRMTVTPDMDRNQIEIGPEIAGDTKGLIVRASLLDGETVASANSSRDPSTCPLLVPATTKRWSPADPFLYDLKVELERDGKVIDTVTGYVGLRKIEVAKDEKGVNRLKLNGEFVFQVGPLDQGFWPDGLYTAPTDEALRYDIEVTKTLGFNMTRKHVKVEPDRWYYWCDKLGLLVWQDMVAGDKGIGPDDPDSKRSPEAAKQFEAELKAMIDGRRNHPSIILWVVFNEGWGQFDTARLTDWVKQYDRLRLVDCASGWTDRPGVGDVHDLHAYPHPAAPPAEPKRAGVLGEFGGLGLGVDGHTWSPKTWGYQGAAGRDDLTRKYEGLLRESWELKDAKGLNAVVYTQITDVETEANGLLTYDREVIKVDTKRVAAANRGDFSMAAKVRAIVPTSRDKGQTWRYTTETPPAGWQGADFDDSGWKSGPGVLGTEKTPGAAVRTKWDTPDVWARRVVVLPELNPANVILTGLHDDAAEFYLNGVLVASPKNYLSNYEEMPLPAEARATLKPGKAVIAVHCHQNGGGQSVDAGLVEVGPAKDEAEGKKAKEDGPKTKEKD